MKYALSNFTPYLIYAKQMLQKNEAMQYYLHSFWMKSDCDFHGHLRSQKNELFTLKKGLNQVKRIHST